MAKFYGKIGFIKTEEVEPGVWVENNVIERSYFGDVIKNISRNQPTGNVNDDINVSNNISIVADPYANENFQYMKYVEFMGAKWKITNATVQYPRILLNIGGLYNG
jgi:hypothetical protein